MSSIEETLGAGHSIDVLERRLVGGDGENHHADYDQPLELQLRLRFNRQVEDLRVTFELTTDTGLPVSAQTSSPDALRTFEPGEETLIRLPFRARLGGGNYALAARLADGDGHPLGGCENVMLFVSGRPGSLGVIDLRAEIEVDGVDRTDLRSTLLEV
jgi:methionine-rich copper-binding protein CopC